MREPSMNRRRLLSGMAAAGIASVLPASQASAAAQGKAVVNGRIRQSVVFWCFNAMGDRWDLERTCRVASDLGCQSIEDRYRPKSGRFCAAQPASAIAFNGMPGMPFMRLQQPAYHEEVIDRTRKTDEIDAHCRGQCAERHRLHRLQVANADDPGNGEISKTDSAKQHGARLASGGVERTVKRRVTVCIDISSTRDTTRWK